MRLVANKSFHGHGVDFRKGRLYELELDDEVAVEWLEAGIVREATDDDTQPVTATTFTTPVRKTTRSKKATGGSEPKGDKVVTDPKTETKPPVDPASKPTGEPTGNGDQTVSKSPDDVTTTTKVETGKTESVKPDVTNTKPNETKVSK